MIGFWIFFLLSGISVAAYASFVWSMGPVAAVLLGVATVLFLRGAFSYVKRKLILGERIADEDDSDIRTLETNRFIFWQRIFAVSLLLVIYFTVVGMFFNLAPLEALAVLPQLLLQLGLQVGQLGALLLANFALFFGPFLLFGLMGRQTIQPDDANYNVKIEDVRGQKSAVTEMRRILRLIEQGRNFVKAGGKRERGVLLVGPPGTGKTMLAKAIASSLRMPIIITSGSAFSGMFMGMDMVSVIMMVRAAKKKAKRWGGCAIFIDEFDTLGQRRSGMGGGGMMGGMMGMGGGQLGLNALLVQMDGVDNPGFFKRLFRRTVNVTLDGLFVPRDIRFNGTHWHLRVPHLKAPRYNLFFMGATNRPQVLDEAVTRPGRFGRSITFRMPTREDRKDIADLYFANKKHDPSLDTPEKRDEFARISEGYSPAMIEQSTSLALMYAFEDGRDFFTWRDIREAMGNIESGLVQPVEYTEREAVATARHEVGHAVALRYFQSDHAPVRLSIKMRADGSLGRLSYQQQEEEFSRFRTQMAGSLRTTLGAIAAERVFYGENSAGVFGDLMQATRLACHMVGMVGMGPDPLPVDESRRAIEFGEYLISIAEVTQGMIDGGSAGVGATLGNGKARRVVAQVLGAAYVDCWRLMFVNREAIDLAAQALIAQGEIVGDEITGLLDSVNLRAFTSADPYPPDVIHLPRPEDEQGETGRERRSA